MKLLILGSDGMAGHVVKQYMSESGHEVVDCQDADDQVADYETMVKEMCKWTDSHKNIYRYQ